MLIEQNRLARELQSQSTLSPAAATAGSSDLVRLVIPKIHLSAVVVEGTSRKALLVGPGHVANTARPGDTGNAVLAGHRDTFFRHLGELLRGDPIYYIGPAPKRLIVFAQFSNSAGQGEKRSFAGDESR